MPHIPQRDRVNWAQADKIRASHADAIERVRGQRDLSEAGRRKRIAKIAVQTRDRLAALEADDRERLAAKAATLEHDLFRPRGRTAVDQLNARDAATRAAQIENPGQAQRLLTVAKQLGDDVLAAAVARRCVDLCDDQLTARTAWPLVLAWADTVPGAHDTLAELGGIEHETGDAMARLERSQHFRPGAIRELAGHNIDQLAAQADADTDLRPPSSTEQAGQRMASFVHGEVE